MRSIASRSMTWLGSILGAFLIAGPALAATHTPADSTALSNLLNGTTLQLGDTIILNAGTTYTGQFVLPKVDTGVTGGWITIQSSNLSALPAAGVRVNATDAANMPKIAAPGAGSPSGGTFEVPLKTATTAHHYKLIGLELRGPANNVASWELLRLGSGDTDQTTVASVAHHFVVDRCILRANSATQMIRRAVEIDTADTDIINCHIADIWDTTGQSIGIGGANGTGNYNIINNYIECAGINFIIGGAGARIPGVIPENIVFQKNHCIKDEAAWRSNAQIQVVNLFEIKFGRHFDIQGNIFEKTWKNEQNEAIIFKVASGQISVNTADKMVSEDILFANNIVRSAPAAFHLQGRDWQANRPTELRGVTIRNNLCYDISRAVYSPGFAGTTGHFIYSNHGGENFTIENNTCFQDISALWLDSGGTAGLLPRVNFIFRNNVLRGNMQPNPDGHINSSSPSLQGTAALDTHAPDAIFKKNAIPGLTSTLVNNATNGYKVSSTTGADHKADNWLILPADFSTVLQNYNGGVPTADFAGWKLVAGSVYETGASPNGGPIGCDINAVVAATAGCISGVWGAPPPPPPPSGLIASDSFSYTVPGSLNTQNGGTGFASGWAAVSGQTNPALAAGSMAYTSGNSALAIAGNKIQPAAVSRSVRNLATHFVPVQGSVLWASFRIKHNGTGSDPLPSNHAGFALYSTTNAVSGTDNLFLGNPGFSGQNWGFNPSNGTRVVASGTVATGAPRNVLLLYKLVYGASSAAVSMWINPSMSEGSLGTAQATGTQPGLIPVRSVMMSTGDTASGYQFDELRVGTTFADVMPAATFVYEGLNYTGTLNGKSGGVVFGAAWASVTGATNPALGTGSLTYISGSSSLPTVGNKLTPANSSGSRRDFPSAFPTGAGKTYWVSFRANYTGTLPVPSNNAGFSLYSDPGAAGTYVFLGKPGFSGNNWGFDHSGTVTTKNSGAMVAGEKDAFLVYKVEFTATNVTISMWVNKGLNEAALGTPDATASKAHSTPLASLKFSTGTNAANYQFDEFRFGTTFADVAPTD